MWILGGWRIEERSLIRLNDVWRSPDGSSWEKVAEQAAWSPRNVAGSLSFAGKIWILGGLDGRQALNDVWSSTDGRHWELVTAAAPWSRRCSFGCLVFDRRIWVMGGIDRRDSGRYVPNAEVWSSPDGVRWDLVTERAEWGTRANFPALVFNRKMWILGGGSHGPEMLSLSDVWCSTDGAQWRPATGRAGWEGRRHHSALAFDNSLWVWGGIASETANVNDVWISPDGADWRLVHEAAPWDVRHAPVSLVFKGQAWLMGGYGGMGEAGPLYNDVWTLEPS